MLSPASLSCKRSTVTIGLQSSPSKSKPKGSTTFAPLVDTADTICATQLPFKGVNFFGQ